MSFRFGFQSTAKDLAGIERDAQAAEAAGFHVFQLGDHLGNEPAPIVALTATAAATQRIGLGTLVLNNDLRHPFPLAQELATLDRASEGRLEVGLGAGHAFTEYRAAGLPFDPPAVRKQRLAESVEILRSLLDGVPTTFRGQHYTLDGATVPRPHQQHVPILVGVSGRNALDHAATHADVVALTMLGRTLADGQHHELRWETSRLDDAVAGVRAAAAAAGRSVTLHALVQAVVVTRDRKKAAQEIAIRHQLALTDVLATPFLCLGTHDDMADHLTACASRWGITYYTVRVIDEMAPVFGLLPGE